MFVIEQTNVDFGYLDVISTILSSGNRITRRGMEVMESRGVLILDNPRDRVVQNPARKLSPRFLAGEFFWIFLGDESVQTIRKFNSKMSEYSDDGLTLYGAYGPRIKNQLQDVKKKFLDDVYTRQAIVVISRPSDLLAKTKDFPCNSVLHFNVDTDNKLSLTTFVRSQDLLLGFPYDIFHWTLFQESLAVELNLGIGKYFHVMSNCHIYTKDLEKMENISSQKNYERFEMNPMITSPWEIEDKISLSFYSENLDTSIGGIWKDLLLASFSSFNEIEDRAIRKVSECWKKNSEIKKSFLTQQ